MSKKQLYSRLNKVFTHIETTIPPQPESINQNEITQVLDSHVSVKVSAAEVKENLSSIPKSNGSHTNPSVQISPPDPSIISEGYDIGIQGIAIENGLIHPTSEPFTSVAGTSLQTKQAVNQSGTNKSPAALAIPFKYSDQTSGLIEIIDDETPLRNWSEDEWLLAQEVANQLALAIENARLYAVVQKELSDRVRAEQETLRRNQDLTVLNQIGQELSKLTNHDEIVSLLFTTIGQLIGDENLGIYVVEPGTNAVKTSIVNMDGVRQAKTENILSDSIPGYVLRTKSTIIFSQDVYDQLIGIGIEPASRVPNSIFAVPLLASDRLMGAIVAQNYYDKKYTSFEIELISTISAQATTALENANLFLEIRNALQAIETRERYQANVAQTIALLSKSGTKAMPEILETLGQAAQCSHVYYAQIIEDPSGAYWSVITDWKDGKNLQNFDGIVNHHLSLAQFPNWADSLGKMGYLSVACDEFGTSAEIEFLTKHDIRSSLLISVPGKGSTPNFIGFDEVGQPRKWMAEEINILRVATDGLKNTILREDLMEQLQASLDETEHLYNASHKLALASDLPEMINAIALGLHTPVINRVELVLFDKDNKGDVDQMVVTANWYAGRGTPPLPVGAKLDHNIFRKLFCISSASFYDDIHHQLFDRDQLEVLTSQNIRSLSVLPLWAGKQQLGVLMLQSDNRHHFTGLEIRSYPPLVDQMATAVENNRLFEQTQKALAETENLYQIGSGISKATNTQELMKLVAQSIMPVNSERVSILKVMSSNLETLDLEIVGFYSRSMEYQSVGLRLTSDDLPIIKKIDGEILYISDIPNSDIDNISQDTLMKLDIQADCLIPMAAAGRVVGFLNVSSSIPSIFLPDEIHTLQVAASSIAIAMERQRLLEEAQRRALELKAAAEIARDTTSTLSLDILLPRIVNLVIERFKYNHASIFLVDETGTFAVIREATGQAGIQMKQANHRHAVGSRSVIGMVTSTGTPVIINNVISSTIHARNPFLTETKSEMALPLKLGDRLTGALDIQSNQVNAFSPDDVAVLQILADQIAVAIENAQAYELSQKAIEDMKEVDRVKSQFLANMSHELRTPLNSIIGFSRVILKGIDGPINDIQIQDLTAIYNSGQHLLSLITDILDLSKIEAGKMELSFSEVDLNDLINSVLSTAIGLVKDKPIKLVHNLPQKVPIIPADQTRIRQVLINLISNAAKFTEEGSITVELGMTKDSLGKNEVIIKVIDTGPGIAEKDQVKLFQPFSQVDDSPTRKTGGTGLGLSISRSFIEMHNGRIGLLKSEVGVGSTFFFTLPCPQETIEPEPQSPTINDPIVLCIDDDPQVISLYQRYLSSIGYQVMAVTDPKTALDRVKEIKPFAITLDIMMPEKDGWSVMHDLKNDSDTRNIPVIICSILEEEEKGVNLGAADYLVKPFLPDDLTNAITRQNNHGQIHKVLVIDDDLGDLRLVEKMLTEYGKFQVTTAEGGLKGWDSLLIDHPDIVIVDLFMPDMDGFTIIERMRSDTVLNSMPVIILSGADLTVEQHQKLSDFGKELLQKGSFKENELLTKLETTLRNIRTS